MTSDFELALAELDFFKSQLDLYRHRIDDAARKGLDIVYVRRNNNLEGGSLDRDETEILLKTGLMSPNKPMAENLLALNLFQAVQFVREQAGEQALLTEAFIKRIHAILARAVDRQGGGCYRTASSPISANPRLPSADELPALIEAELHELRLQGPFMHPVVHAAEIHLKLFALQPFASFNAICARLAMNLILLEEGFPMFNIVGDDAGRLAYGLSLSQALHRGDKSVWLMLVARQTALDSQILLNRLELMSGDAEDR